MDGNSPGGNKKEVKDGEKLPCQHEGSQIWEVSEDESLLDGQSLHSSLDGQPLNPEEEGKLLREGVNSRVGEKGLPAGRFLVGSPWAAPQGLADHATEQGHKRFTPSPFLEPTQPILREHGLFSKDHTSEASGGCEKKTSDTECEQWGLGDIATWLSQFMDSIFLEREALPTGGVFPLPSSMEVLHQLFPSASSSCVVLLRVLCGFEFLQW